jgi:hypothetical protein
MAELLSPPVIAPGLYDLTAQQYHADPCPAPSLSHSIAKLIDRRSPRHAWRKHPRLGGSVSGSGGNRDMAIGSAAHAMALGKGAAIARINADDYRTKDAKQARDAAYAQGFVPLLASDWAIAEALGEPARYAMEKFLGAKMKDCLVETTIITCPGGKWRRSMLDVTTPDLRVTLDYKTTEDASEEACDRQIRSMSYNTQKAFYLRRLDEIDPQNVNRRVFYLMFQERDCPEAITFHNLDAAMLEIAQGRMERAEKRWDECLEAGEWPAYPLGPYLHSPRPYEMDDEIAAQDAEIAA